MKNVKWKWHCGILLHKSDKETSVLCGRCILDCSIEAARISYALSSRWERGWREMYLPGFSHLLFLNVANSVQRLLIPPHFQVSLSAAAPDAKPQIKYGGGGRFQKFPLCSSITAEEATFNLIHDWLTWAVMVLHLQNEKKPVFTWRKRECEGPSEPCIW